MTTTLCMRINQPSRRMVLDALNSALQMVKPTEVLLAPSPNVLDGKREYRIQTITAVIPAEIPFRLFKGTSDRTKMAKHWFHLFDEAKGDWIVNLDDDDMVLSGVNLDEIPEDAGFFHTDVLAVYIEPIPGQVKAGFVMPRRSGVILHPDKAKKAIGSFWGMRRAAWDTIKDIIERDQPGFNDFKIVWHLVRMGWKGWYIPELKQLQRARDSRGIKIYQAAHAAGGWSGACERLWRKYGGQG